MSKLKKILKSVFKIAGYTIGSLSFFCCCAMLYFWLSGEVRQSIDRRSGAPKMGRFIEVDGSDIFLQEIGPPNGPVLVFVHATIAWGGTWLPTMSWFAERGFHCMAVDMPPMGFSSVSSQGYGREAQGKLLAHLIEILGLQKFTLIGHSFGARATLTSAALVRERLQHLVIVSGAVGWTNQTGPEQPETHFFLHSLLSLSFVRNLLGSIVTHPCFTRPGLELFVANGNSVEDKILRVYQQPFFLQKKSSMIGDWMGEFLTSNDIGLSNDTSEIFPKLTMKTLLVWGLQDTTTPVWQGERMAKRIPSARLVLLDRVGHLPQIEKPGEFRERLLEFLTEGI